MFSDIFSAHIHTKSQKSLNLYAAIDFLKINSNDLVQRSSMRKDQFHALASI